MEINLKWWKQNHEKEEFKKKKKRKLKKLPRKKDKKKEVISLHSPLCNSQQNSEALVTEGSSRDGLWSEREI